MCRSMVDIQSAAAEIRRGKSQERRKKQDKNIMSASAMWGGHDNQKTYVITGTFYAVTINFDP